ncbi:MAG: SDR family oxidoreductase [Pseudomonadota bacterium]
MSISPIMVLTGASRGIGHAIAKRFSDGGWRVITCSREDVPEACAAEKRWLGHIPTDLGDADSVEDFIAATRKLLNGEHLTALVNNAAQSPKTTNRERIGCLDGDMDEWYKVFDLNFFTPLRLCRGFANLLGNDSEDYTASIINITSIAGHAIHPLAGSHYSVSKAALSAMTKELAVELATRGIRVNAIAPGEIVTSMIGPEYEPLVDRIPLGRMGHVDEVAGCVWQMCQPDFRYVTGAEIFVTGGQHLL